MKAPVLRAAGTYRVRPGFQAVRDALLRHGRCEGLRETLSTSFGTNDSIDAVGLMGLLTRGSVPMAINVSAHEEGLAWVVQVARQDRDWLALSDSKQWNCVYLYSTGARDEPQWTWERTYQGVARPAE
jgi:hypothetical protein